MQQEALVNRITSHARGATKTEEEITKALADNADASEDDKEGEESEDGFDDDTNDILSGMLGGVVISAPTAKAKGKAVPKKKPVPARHTGGSPASSSTPKPKAVASAGPTKQSPPGDPPIKRKRDDGDREDAPKSRGRKPVDFSFDPVTYLNNDGMAPLKAKFDEIEVFLKHEDFASIRVDEVSNNKFQNSLKAVLAKANALSKEIINFQWKVKKRVTIPEGVLDIMAKFRNNVTNVASLMQQYIGNSVESMLDIDKVTTLIDGLEGEIIVPLRFTVLLYKARLLEHVQYQKFGDFSVALSRGTSLCPGVPSDDLQGIGDTSWGRGASTDKQACQGQGPGSNSPKLQHHVFVPCRASTDRSTIVFRVASIQCSLVHDLRDVHFYHTTPACE
jgi:hypothetical protein